MTKSTDFEGKNYWNLRKSGKTVVSQKKIKLLINNNLTLIILINLQEQVDHDKFFKTKFLLD